MPRTPDTAPLYPNLQTKKRAVTFRALLLGLLGVTFICSFTPFNDFVLDTTLLVGNFLPVGLLLFFLLFVLFINAPLSRLLPKWAFSSGEISVALGMTLVSCSLPSSGLMRYLPVGQVAVPWYAGQYDDVAQLFDDPTRHADPDYLKDVDRKVHLPDWVFPTRDPALPKGPVNMAQRGREEVFTNFHDRAFAETFWGHVRAVPWNLWKIPAIAWSLFLLPMLGAMVLMTVLLRRQWVENERLPFPIATVYLSLIEAPQPGRAFNSLFSDKGFWFAFLAVFIIHGFNGSSAYWPKYVPPIPFHFELWSLFADNPWINYFEAGNVFNCTIYFCVVGIAYFLQSKIAFSLFASFLLFQAMRFGYGYQKLEFKSTMRDDEIVGSALTVGFIVIWIGRKHWMLIIRQMLRGPAASEPRGRYLPYRIAGWGFVVCLALMIAWLCVAGATLIGAASLVLYLTLMFMVIARVVAETGMVFTAFNVSTNRIWQVPLEISARLRTTPTSYFWNRYLGWAFFDNRESLSVFSSHALKVADVAADDENGGWRKNSPIIASLALALVFGLLVSFASTLYIHYAYAQTLSNHPTAPVGAWAWFSVGDVFNSTRDYVDPAKFHGKWEGHNHYTYVLIGVVVTAILGFLRFRFAAWPLHPIGFLVCDTYPIVVGWFSIFLGWLAKVLILRFGGAKLYVRARGFFIGLVLGEAAAAAFWMLFGVLRYAVGQTYYPIHLLPT